MKGVIFKYSQSRSAETAQKFLTGYKNILVTDGYAGYNILEEYVNRAECWAHARRYFYESVPLDNDKQMITSADGYTGVKYIDELFKIEKEIAELNIDEKLGKRQEKSAPILKNFYEWVHSTSQKYITNKKLKNALIYATNQKENLCKFLNDGRIPLTNSKAERAIRPFAVHRKNGYLLIQLMEPMQTEENIEKYLPWSKELPEEILNFQGTYKEINLG